VVLPQVLIKIAKSAEFTFPSLFMSPTLLGAVVVIGTGPSSREKLSLKSLAITDYMSAEFDNGSEYVVLETTATSAAFLFTK